MTSDRSPAAGDTAPGIKLADVAALAGRELGVSDWILVDQPLIDAFADVTNDHQYIHVDPVRAASSELGGTIAHGFLVVSLMPQMMESAGVPIAEDMAVSLNYGVDRLRFVSPVRSGRRVRGRFTLAEFEEKKPGRFQQVLEVTVEIEGEERPALVARWISQLAT